MRFKKNPLFWIAAIISLILDHLTKFWVVQNFELILHPLDPDTMPLWPEVFHFTYVVNEGIAFGLFRNVGSFWWGCVSLGVSLALMAMAWLNPRLNRWEQVGYGLILGGALGNGIDRFVSGHVVDFLDFRLINFPIFNLADVSINIGIICLLIEIFRSNSSDRSSNSKR